MSTPHDSTKSPITHTPGPWHLSGKGDERSIVQTSHLTRDVWVIPRNDADWHLIAAAPEMYEALIAVEQVLRKPSDPDAEIKLLEIVRAALAKAEGK